MTQGIAASTMGDTSDILPESLYDSIGISRIDEDPTEEQRQSPSGTTASHCDEELEVRGRRQSREDGAVQDICTKAEPVYSTSGSGSGLAGTVTPSSIPSGTAHPSAGEGTSKESIPLRGACTGIQGSHVEELSHKARLAVAPLSNVCHHRVTMSAGPHGPNGRTDSIGRLCRAP